MSCRWQVLFLQKYIYAQHDRTDLRLVLHRSDHGVYIATKAVPWLANVYIRNIDRVIYPYWPRTSNYDYVTVHLAPRMVPIPLECNFSFVNVLQLFVVADVYPSPVRSTDI